MNNTFYSMEDFMKNALRKENQLNIACFVIRDELIKRFREIEFYCADISTMITNRNVFYIDIRDFYGEEAREYLYEIASMNIEIGRISENYKVYDIQVSLMYSPEHMSIEVSILTQYCKTIREVRNETTRFE